MDGRLAGYAHPLEKSAPDFGAQTYIAYLRGVGVLRTSALRGSRKSISSIVHSLTHDSRARILPSEVGGLPLP